MKTNLNRHHRTLPLLCWLLLLAAPRPGLAADRYAAAMTRAAELERDQRPSAAADALLAVEAEYRQDYTLQLRLGWLLLSAGRREPAARHYRLALELAPDSRDARQGLALCAPRPRVTLTTSAALTAHAYQDHPFKEAALGLTAGLALRFLERGLLNARYRYSYFWVDPSATKLDDIQQHEAHFSAGVTLSRFGLLAQYSYLHEDSGSLGGAHLVGFSARVSPWGDLLLAGNASLYSDMTVYRLSLAWRLPLTAWLALTPGGWLQVARAEGGHVQLDSETEVLGGGSLNLTFSGKRWSAWIGGKYGDEVRPADLDLTSVYNTFDRLRFGAWLGGSLGLGGGWRLWAAYQLDRLQTPDIHGGFIDNNLHLISVGAAWGF